MKPKTKAKSKAATIAVIMRAPDSLTPYANNARTHSPEQVAQIAASLSEFGWTNPILIDPTGGIIAGHGRMLAAIELGMTEVPTITLENLTPEQLRAYIIADNKLALNAGWDESILKLELEELRDSGYDVGIVGFSADELKVLFEGWDSNIKPPGEQDPDDPTAAKITIICSAEEKDSIMSLIKSTLKEGEYADIEIK